MAGSSRTAPRDLGAVAARLFERVAAGESVELAVLSGLERCALGRPTYALVDRSIRLAWDGFGEDRRRKATEMTLAGLRNRGMLKAGAAEKAAGKDAAPASEQDWDASPELGIVQAAQRGPAYLVVTEVDGKTARCLRFFALGEEGRPVRALVAEEPVALPSSSAYKNLGGLGPLAWMTRYRLVSEAHAVRTLTDMALTPRLDRDGTYSYGIRRFQRPEGGAVTEAGISVAGSGTTARVRRLAGAGQSQASEVGMDDRVTLTAAALQEMLHRLLATGSF
jgi:hypothetical protein